MPEEMSRPKISAMAVAAEDRISSLPDEVLSHILSFLPTKQAVATSVLSKMWTHPWRSVVVLDFSGTILETSEAHFLFHKFMYSVLRSRSRDAAHPITSFCLEIEDRVDDSFISYDSHYHVIEWVNIVVQHSVEYLHLKLCDSFDLPLTIPISILTCRTLVVLKLSGFHVKGFSFSSNPFGLPSLKTLHLERIRFPEDRDYVLLLAGCPILEDLLACDVAFGRRDLRTCQEFKSLRLSYLTRANLARYNYSYFPLGALYNLEFLRIQAFRFFYEKGFRYIGELNRCEMYRWHRPCDDIPIFHNLTHLVLDSDWYLVVEVLQHCPELQNLTLRQELRDNWEETIWTKEDKWVEPEFVPQCLSLYLRACTIREFAGLQRELLLARYILKNAGVLQTMTIWRLNNGEQPEIERCLSSCPRASATCQFSVF